MIKSLLIEKHRRVHMKDVITGIIGTGMIASSLAVLTAGHGVKTVLLARSEASKDRCEKTISDFYAQLIDAGLMEEKQAGICRSYISYAFDYKGLKDSGIIFECVAENADIKYEVYKSLEADCPEVKAICSVSSSIVPEVLAKGADKYADRIIVTHPFNPPHLVPYFEVCEASCTAPGVTDFACAFLKILDRKPVVLKKPTPGFIGNRLQFALWREALALVEEGICGPEDVDTCLEFSFCPRYTSIGIFEHFDNGGLQLNAAGCRNIWPILSVRTEIPGFMQKLMEEGKMGAKSPSKTGFYDWNGTDMDAYADRVSAPYFKMFSWKLPEESLKE